MSYLLQNLFQIKNFIKYFDKLGMEPLHNNKITLLNFN